MDLKISNLIKNFKNKEVLKGVNMNLYAGQIYGLLGLNGAGKTTLIKCIFNEVLPKSGTIKINDHQLNYNDYAQMYYFPENDDLPNNLTIYNYLIYIYSLAKKDKKNFNEKFQEFGQILNNINIYKTKIASLSTGQRKVVSLIACQIINPKIIILDEPTANLDIANKETILKLILKLKNENTIILLTTHLIDEVKEYLDYIFIIKDGVVVFDRLTKNLNIKKVFLEAVEYDENKLYI